MCLCNDGKRNERTALSTLFSLLIVPRGLSILVNVLFSLGYPAGASAIERELLIRTGISEGISPSPLFHFLALVSFLARPKPRILFFCLSLLQNSTETLATQTTYRLFKVSLRLLSDNNGICDR